MEAQAQTAAQFDEDGVPSHPLVADGLARAMLQAIMNAERLGVALVRGPAHQHVMMNARYQALAAGQASLGGSITSAWSPACAPPEVLEEVSRTGRPATLREIPSRRVSSHWNPPAYVTTTYHRVVDGADQALLVLVEDVTEPVLARERASLMQSLFDDLLGNVDPQSAVASVVGRTRDVLGATAASLFILDEPSGELRGSIGEWDWTRTSFTVHLRDWPTVERVLRLDERVLPETDPCPRASLSLPGEGGGEGEVCAEHARTSLASRNLFVSP